MISHMHTPIHSIRLLLIALLAVHMAACQSGAYTDSRHLPSQTPAAQMQRADALLENLSKDTPPERLLTAAMLYAAAGAYAKANDALNHINTQALSRNQRGDFLLTQTDAALGLNDLAGAWRTVSRGPDRRHAFIDDLSAEDFARIAERRATILERRGYLADAIRERIVASRQLPDRQRQANQDAMWLLLQRIAYDPLQQLLRSPEADTRGWAALTAIYQNSQDNPALLARRINVWFQDNPEHPAARNPPAVITQARESKLLTNIQHVAVMLPLHGKLSGAGTALQRGLTAAWFNARESGGDMPQLRFYDSSRSDFLATYTDAVNAGAELILGPLEKEHLRLLQAQKELPVTTIALNYPDAPGGPTALYYFGLAGEDEATQIAQFAVQAGLKRVGLLFPAGDWGQRVGQQALQTLAENNGSAVAVGVYQGNGDYNQVMHDLLDIKASELRHNRLERLLGKKLSFQPRRRPDIDALLIVANSAQASQLIPAAHYYYAGDLPMFATSHINDQSATTTTRDLNGVKFIDMPWIVEPNQPMRQRMSTAWRDIDERYIRLYALGIDAWRVSQNRLWMSQSADETVKGVTGLLSMDQDRKVHRELVWMKFRNGRAERIDEHGQ